MQYHSTRDMADQMSAGFSGELQQLVRCLRTVTAGCVVFAARVARQCSKERTDQSVSVPSGSGSRGSDLWELCTVRVGAPVYCVPVSSSRALSSASPVYGDLVAVGGAASFWSASPGPVSQKSILHACALPIVVTRAERRRSDACSCYIASRSRVSLYLRQCVGALLVHLRP